MPKFELFHPDHEHTGQMLIEFKNAVGGKHIDAIFKKHGLDEIDPQAWYPAQKLLDVIEDLQANSSLQMLDLVSIGMRMVENAIVPPGFESLTLMDILSNSEAIYRISNRGTDVGEIKCEMVDSQHVKLHLRLAQPDDLWYGVFYGYVRRFAPSGSDFVVYYDETAPRRSAGASHTIIHISWR